MNDFASLLKGKRKQVGMTQIELAEAAGVAVNSIRLYEGGKRTPSVYIAFRLACALNGIKHNFAEEQVIALLMEAE